MAQDKQSPRYRLTEKAFMSGVRLKRGRDWIPFDDILLDPAEMPLVSPLNGPFAGFAGDGDRAPLEIEYDGVPAYFMEPLNDAAKAMFAKHQRSQINPIDALTIIGPHAKVLRELGDSV